MEKWDWRNRMKERFSASDPARNRAESFAISHQLEGWLEASATRWQVEGDFPYAAVFVPRKDEPDIRPVWNQFKAHGFQLCLPSCMTDEKGKPALQFRAFSGDKRELVEAAYGLMEPQPEAKNVPVADISLVLVPGMAFSADTGGRLGRGKGYYDRFLAQVPEALRMAPAFTWQLAGDLPLGAHDQRMDLLVTAKGILHFTR